MSKTTEMLYKLSDLQDSIEAQRTQRLAKLEADYAKAKAELVKHAKSYQTQRLTVSKPDCKVQLVPTNSKSKDWNALAELAKSLGATDEQIDALITETPSWSVKVKKI